MSHYITHPYHIVDESPWPIYSSAAGRFLTIGLLVWFHCNSYLIIVSAIMLLLLIVSQWWRDVRRERSVQGLHTAIVEINIHSGIILFITSEVLFFLRFFWAYFHARLAPNVELGGVWPPPGVIPFDPFGVPLLNTIILVSSGVSVTWAHHALIEGNYKQTVQGLGLTVLLGLYFTFLQGLEYYEARFSFADRIFGSTFFIATGFHGLHVIVGTLFLLVCFYRHLVGEFSKNHHFGLEAAAWYWHFVDVVWLFLYLAVYWWGGV